MDPATLTYLNCRMLASWQLAVARAWMQAAGGLGPLPQARVVRIHPRRAA